MATLRGRFILSHTLPLLLVMPLMGIVFIFLLESEVILVNLSVQLERQANLIAEFVVHSPQLWVDPVMAQQIVDRFDPLTTANLSFVQADGRLLAAGSPVERQQIGQYVTDPHLSIALGGVSSRDVHYGRDLDADVAHVFVPVFYPDSKEVIGVVGLTQELSSVYHRFERVRSIVVWVLTPGLFLGIGMGIVLATLMERPLVALSRRIAQVAGEDRTLAADPAHSSLPERGPKEIRLLIHSFNGMVGRLQALELDRRHLLANLLHELGRPLGALRSAIDALLAAPTNSHSCG
jgi:two-component system, OmpR family, sensor histidine kinase BaeS